MSCRHSNHTFPMTPKLGPREGQTYVACLECGVELQYDWARMRIGKELKPTPSSRVSVLPKPVVRAA